MRRIVVLMALFMAACGSDASTDTTADPGGGTPAPLYPGATLAPSQTAATVCEPSGAIGGDTGDQLFEAVEEYLTGFRITEENEGEDPPDDANFGGIWGDMAGGMIVALVDCSQVDIDEVVRLGGGSERVRVIEVPLSQGDVERVRNALANELAQRGIDADVLIDSTFDGKVITVNVLDAEALPSDFGSDAGGPFLVQEVDSLFSENVEEIG